MANSRQIKRWHSAQSNLYITGEVLNNPRLYQVKLKAINCCTEFFELLYKSGLIQLVLLHHGDESNCSASAVKTGF